MGRCNEYQRKLGSKQACILRKKDHTSVSKCVRGRKWGFSIPMWGIYQYVYKTRPSFLDRRILAQTVKEEKDISNGSDSLGSR